MEKDKDKDMGWKVYFSDNERYADLIKRASTPSSKASYRKSKVDAAARHDSRIESYKRQIENAKESLARLKK